EFQIVGMCYVSDVSFFEMRSTGELAATDELHRRCPSGFTISRPEIPLTFDQISSRNARNSSDLATVPVMRLRRESRMNFAVLSGQLAGRIPGDGCSVRIEVNTMVESVLPRRGDEIGKHSGLM